MHDPASSGDVTRGPRLALSLAPCALLGLLAAVLFPCAPARAQCGTEWVPVAGVPGTNHWVVATTDWDPDGAGPASPVLVASGWFLTAGDVAANHIAIFDPATGSWSPLDSGLTGASTGFMTTNALATLPNGDLVAGGNFARAGSASASNIARWDGTSWHPLGAGLNGAVNALCIAPNGDLLAGGSFTVAGGVTAWGIARWDGTSWHALGSGTSHPVTAVAVLQSGDVVAGGYFTSAGGIPANSVARWDGAAWHALGGGIAQTFGLQVRSFAVLPNGDLVVGGAFLQAGNVSHPNLARWNGTSWSGFGTGANSTVDALLLLPNGDLVVAGRFDAIDGVPARRVARWDGANWSALGAGLGSLEVYALAALPGGDLFAGGDFKFTGAGTAAWNLARWDGTTWKAVSPGTDGTVYALAERANGGVVAAGRFTMVAGVSANGIAAWDGASWSALGSGIGPGSSGIVTAMAKMTNGDLVVGGTFTTAGGVAANSVARWDGVSWHALGSGLGAPSNLAWVRVCIAHSTGDLFVGGAFANAGALAVNGIARWDGAAWHALGSGVSGSAGTVHSLVEMPNGDIVAGGQFSSAGGVNANFIARWDGTSWHPLGAGVDNVVEGLAVLPNGDLVAAGYFATAGGASANRIARWDGSSWHPLGSGTNSDVHALEVLPNGDLVAGGGFTMAGSVSAQGLARWDGSSWSAIGNAFQVRALQLRNDGVLAVGGDFTLAGGTASAFLAEWRSTCPATTRTISTTCAGSAGPIMLSAHSMPWVGATFESEGIGFAPGALAASVLGFTSPNMPLSSWTPLAGPGCFQLASHEAIALAIPQAGRVVDSLRIPNASAYAGLVLFQQFLQLEPGGVLQPALVSGSNGLRLTIGTF